MPARIGSPDEEQLALVILDCCSDRHLRGLIAGHAFAHLGHPLDNMTLSIVELLGILLCRDLDVGGDLQDLLEALLLVKTLGEPQAGLRHCCQ